MKTDTYLYIIIIQVVMFIFLMTVVSIHNRTLIKSADKRLEKANEMVLRLAGSADKLSETVSSMKELMITIEKTYTNQLEATKKNRDEFRDSYIKLLHKYEMLEARIIDDYEKEKDRAFGAIREMAKKPTISNSNTTNPA